MASVDNSQSTVPQSPRLAAVVIVANDEDRIAVCLESVAWADTVYAVDLGSTDRSAETCTAGGRMPIALDSLPAALASENCDWVLLVQGHEEVTSELREAITAVLSGRDAGGAPRGYRIGRHVEFLGRRLRSRGGQATDRVRLAHRDALDWGVARRMPQSLPVDGDTRELGAVLSARPCQDLQHYMRRMNVVTTATAKMRRRTGTTSGWRDLATVPLGHGLRAMPGALLRDGLAGVIFTVLETYAIAVSRAKCWELQQTQAPG
jgi:hypothetical protein